MFAATFYDLYKNAEIVNMHAVSVIIVGFAAAFLSSVIVIKWFIKFISSHDFKIFAYYRIIFGLALLLFYYFTGLL